VLFILAGGVEIVAQRVAGGTLNLALHHPSHFAMQYRFLCIVIGEKTEFSVKVDDADLVDELKDAIKKKVEHALGAFDAHALTLYKVEINRSNAEEYIKNLQEASQNPSSNPRLDPADELKVHYASSPPPQMLHILVELPRSELRTGAKLAVLVVLMSPEHTDEQADDSSPSQQTQGPMLQSQPPRGELCTGAKPDVVLTRSGESGGCQLGPQRAAVLYVLEVRKGKH
jgi:Crinkler effector protein N-terminal domain